MKLHRLDLEGFGPFLERQTVDFDAFDADGLFLISGRTGAGKSSILDGVCFSLYGTAPRYDGGDRGLRSDHCAPDDPTAARLEFSAAGRRWRVTRTPAYERPKKNGSGTTPANATVLIEELVGGAWIPRAARAREAAELLDEIVGLNRDQFQQVILLAQNRFAEFLLAKNDDRQAVLRTLFGSRRYEDYELAFEARRRAAQQAAETDAETLRVQLSHVEALIAENDLGGQSAAEQEPYSAAPDAMRSRIQGLAAAVPRAVYRAEASALHAEAAAASHDDALAAFGAQSALRKRQAERLASRAALAALEEREHSVADDRMRVERSRAAEVLRVPVEAAARARAAVVRAADIERDARAAWSAVGDSDAASAALRDMIEEIAGDLAVWARAADIERSLPGLEAEQISSAGRVADYEASIAASRAASSVRTERIAALEPRLASAEAAAPSVDAADAALAAAAARLAAGREAARLAPVAAAAEAAHLGAATRREECSAAVRSLLHRRLEGYAGELAAGLAGGEPCAVCGSTQHPQPASTAAEPVTDEAVAAAEALVEVANHAVIEASELAREQRAAHQDAVTRAGGQPLDLLESAYAGAAALAQAAAAAAELVAGLKRELQELRSAQAAAATEADALTARLVAAREELASFAQQVEAARATVDAARGPHAAVADRVARARARRDLAVVLADAADDLSRLEAAAVSAEADRDGRLRGSVFADADEASAALLDESSQTALAGGIRAHEVALATERDRLLVLETELAGVPDELLDLEAASAAAAAAQARWKEAVAASVRDASLAAQLTDAAARAAETYDATLERAAEFELVAGVANAVAGRNPSRMDLETFVLAAELEQIVVAANLRLDIMSSGRYSLHHSDAVGARNVASGLGLVVLDAHTGQARPPQSLSGGETFLASLALALGLAQVVTQRAGGIRLDTLFIDEGFGSLDSETLELAMQTLDELRQGGRTVGLISHVDSMKERLPAQLVVESTRQGPSVIRQAGPSAADGPARRSIVPIC